MKITLDDETVGSLNTYLEKRKKLKPSIGRSRSVAANKIILEFIESATSQQSDALDLRLVSPIRHRSQLLKTISDLTTDADAETLNALEKTLSRMQALRTVKRVSESETKPAIKENTEPHRVQKTLKNKVNHDENN